MNDPQWKMEKTAVWECIQNVEDQDLNTYFTYSVI